MEPNFLLHAIAGTIGGVMGIYVGSPFDVIKLRMQISSRGALAIARDTWAAEGVRGFFKGAAAVSMGQAPVNAVIFATNSAALRVVEDWRGGGSRVAPVSSLCIAGCCSGLAQAFFLSPFELVKVQQQSVATPLSMMETARAIVERRGIRGLTRGLGATCARDAPTFGFYFSTYEISKRAGNDALGIDGSRGDSHVAVLLGAGALAGAASWAIALPADVIKSRVQAAPLETPRAELRLRVITAAILKEGGLSAFFRGFVPCVLRAIPVNSVTFLVYETVLSALAKGVTPTPT